MTTYATDSVPALGRTSRNDPVAISGDHGHAVSWSAVLAGAVAAAALSLILLVLGTGLGLSSVSPWTSRGVSSTTAGVGTVIWILLVALAASGMGGYLAGRLRARWSGAVADEVYFRDTAHGFLAWAVATLLTAGLLTSTIGSILGTGAEAAGSVAATAGSAAVSAAAGGASTLASRTQPGDDSASSLGYFTDALFRAPATVPGTATAGTVGNGIPAATGTSDTTTAAPPVAEVGKIFARSIASGSVAPEDKQYIGQLIAQRTGLSQQDAEKRVADTYAKAQQAMQDAETKAKEAADKARKSAAYTALWLFVSLLLGAFSASLMATFGGRHRDL